MWDWLSTGGLWVLLSVFLLLNLLGIGLVAMQLPGTWFMLLLTAVVAWITTDVIGLWVLLVLLALAVLGEVLEFIAGAAGSRSKGGSKRAAAGAMIGGVLGAVLGTFIPVPVLGTIFGACVGAGAGSIAGDQWAGRSWDQSLEAGKGAAIGKFWGTIAKVAVAVAMWLTTAVAVFA